MGPETSGNRTDWKVKLKLDPLCFFIQMQHKQVFYDTQEAVAQSLADIRLTRDEGGLFGCCSGQCQRVAIMSLLYSWCF